MDSSPHFSVLLQETLSIFSGCQIDVFVDGTLGAGGHSKAILEAHPEIQLLIGIDRDDLALSIAKERLSAWQNKVRLIKGSFGELAEILQREKIDQVQGILLDLGVSSMQIDLSERGFSFMRDGPLDMRMDQTQELTAEQIVNTWPEDKLAVLIRDYGEEPQWRSAANAIVKARDIAPIKTTLQLATLLGPILYKTRGKGINPATLVFQGLRIAVNAELEQVKTVIPAAHAALSPGGRLALISFHSLEDRIVKNAFRYFASDKEDTSGYRGMFIDKIPTAKILTSRPLVAATEEIEANPRSRSAKIRAIQKI